MNKSAYMHATLHHLNVIDVGYEEEHTPRHNRRERVVGKTFIVDEETETKMNEGGGGG